MACDLNFPLNSADTSKFKTSRSVSDAVAFFPQGLWENTLKKNEMTFFFFFFENFLSFLSFFLEILISFYNNHFFRS